MDDIGTYSNGQNGGGLPERLRKNPFSLPEGYFSGLETDIRSRARLDALRGEGSFSVPDGYFDRLARDVFAKAARKRPVSAFRFRAQKWARYAAAAAVAIVSALGIYTIALDRAVPDAQLAAIPEEEIIHYLASSTGSEDMAYIAEYLYLPQDADGVGQYLDNEDIEDYLNHTL